MFKKLLLTLALAVGLGSAAFAVTNASYVRWPVSTGNISTSAWSTLVASTTKSVKGITVLNTSERDILIGINLAGSASSGVVAQMIVPSNASGALPSFYPLSVSQGYRIAAEAVSLTATTGAIYLNAIYQ